MVCVVFEHKNRAAALHALGALQLWVLEPAYPLRAAGTGRDKWVLVWRPCCAITFGPANTVGPFFILTVTCAPSSQLPCSGYGACGRGSQVARVVSQNLWRNQHVAQSLAATTPTLQDLGTRSSSVTVATNLPTC